MSRCVSTDQGRTWSPPEVRLVLEGQQRLCLLPDGGIAMAPRGNPCLHVSYDEGLTWNYALSGGGNTMGLFLHGKDNLVVFSSRGSHARYEWVANER